MKTQMALFNKSLFPEAWLLTSDKTASALATSVITSLGVDTSTEVNFAEIPSYQGHNIYPCLFQINTSDPSSGTVLTFDKVKLLSLFYVTCCACFRSSNKLSHAQRPPLWHFQCFNNKYLPSQGHNSNSQCKLRASTTLNNLANNSLKLQLEHWVSPCHHNSLFQGWMSATCLGARRRCTSRWDLKKYIIDGTDVANPSKNVKRLIRSSEKSNVIHTLHVWMFAPSKLHPMHVMAMQNIDKSNSVV